MHLGLPWRMLSSQLISRRASDGPVDYRQWFTELAIQEPNMDVRRSATLTPTFRAFSRRFYPEQLTISTFCQKKEKQQTIAVGAVRMFIEPSAKHKQSLG